jgi:ribosomal-protein-alanine N-acetyltransferase
MREKEAKNPECFFAIRRPDGYLIGAIGTGFDGKSHSAEFGYWLCSAYRGRNIMPLVIQKFAKHAFHRLSVHRLQATIFSGNESSARALIKAGFAREGLLRHYYMKNGEYIDGVSYSLLDTDTIPIVVMK